MHISNVLEVEMDAVVLTSIATIAGEPQAWALALTALLLAAGLARAFTLR